MVGELLLGFRWVLGVIFVAAGAMKIGAAQSFAQSIASYRLVPEFLHHPIARSLPILEICLGTACVLGVLPMVAGWVAFVLLLGFASGVGWNLMRGRRFDCGCGCGTMHATRISWGLVLRDLGLAAVAVAVAVGPSGALAVWRGSSAVPNHLPAMSDLISIPMTVTLLLAAGRLLSASRSVWTESPRPGHSSDDMRASLPIVQVNGPANRVAKVP
jgi:uncharacterized membrane protein YphA (DoxX/SURF4 family)